MENKHYCPVCGAELEQGQYEYNYETGNIHVVHCPECSDSEGMVVSDTEKSDNMNTKEPTFNPEIWKDEYFDEKLTENCPNCGEEVEVFHSILKQGFKYICPNCGMPDHFCSLCIHAEDNPEQYCDWEEENEECWRDRQWREYNKHLPFKDIDEIFDHDIYYVEEDADGNKQINVQRYYYDDENINIVEYCGIRLPIPCTREEFEDAILESKQYSGPVSLDRSKAIEKLKKDMVRIKKLPIEEVNEFTSLGKYIDMK